MSGVNVYLVAFNGEEKPGPTIKKKIQWPFLPRIGEDIECRNCRGDLLSFTVDSVRHTFSEENSFVEVWFEVNDPPNPDPEFGVTDDIADLLAAPGEGWEIHSGKY